jgi:hypothetical protein
MDIGEAGGRSPRLENSIGMTVKGNLQKTTPGWSIPIDKVLLTAERRSEIETESVHAHLRYPIAEAIHDELQDPWVERVRRVAGSREYELDPRLVSPAFGYSSVRCFEALFK